MAGAELTSLSLAPPAALNHSTLVSHVASSTVLHINVCLQMPNPTALQAFADDVSNPVSPHYRQFLTPAQIGEQFGQPASTVAAVVSYLKSKGISVTLQAPDNLHIMADGTVAQIESAFNTTINNYHSNNPKETGHVDFISYAQAPKLPSNIAGAVQNIGGLQTWDKPFHHTTLTPLTSRALYNTTPLYNGGDEGQGRTVGISNWDGFSLSNLPLYIKFYNLPVPSGGAGSNVRVVTIDGGSGSGPAQGEGDLDQQMVIGQAPLSNVIVYDGGGDNDSSILLDVLTREANDNLADIISESYGWSLDTSTAISAHNIHVQMTAQGITYMAAAGDYFAEEEQTYPYPDSEPEALIVGGTAAQVDSQGNRQSEVVWSEQGVVGTGGGWTTTPFPFNTLPSWLKGTGVPTGINYRINPDVSGAATGSNTLSSDFGAYDIFVDGSFGGVDGTSCASPAFAGGLAVAEQELVKHNVLPKNSAGKQRMGRLQDMLYKWNGKSSVFYDITSGSNGSLPNGQTSTATKGWDTASGWGAINWDGFVQAVSALPPKTVAPYNSFVWYDPNNDPKPAAEGVATGTFSQLANADGSYYSVQSVSRNAGQSAAAVIEWQLATADVANLTQLNLTLAVNGPATATQYVYLWNFVSNQWDTLPIYTGPFTGSTSSVTLNIDTTKYLEPTYNLVFIIDRGVLPARLGNNPFKMNIDQAILTESF